MPSNLSNLLWLIKIEDKYMVFSVQHKPTGLRLKKNIALWWSIDCALNGRLHWAITKGAGHIWATKKAAEAIQKKLGKDWRVVRA